LHNLFLLYKYIYILSTIITTNETIFTIVYSLLLHPAKLALNFPGN